MFSKGRIEHVEGAKIGLFTFHESYIEKVIRKKSNGNGTFRKGKEG